MSRVAVALSYLSLYGENDVQLLRVGCGDWAQQIHRRKAALDVSLPRTGRSLLGTGAPLPISLLHEAVAGSASKPSVTVSAMRSHLLGAYLSSGLAPQ